MTKIQFLYELDERLSKLSNEDRNTALEYYSEMIDDRIEDGMSESAAVAALGSIEDIYAETVSAIPLHKLIKLKLSKRKATGIWNTTLKIFGFIVFGIPVIATIFSVIVSLYAALWSVVASFFAVTVALGAGGIAGVGLFFPTVFIGMPVKAIFLLGAGLFSAGLVLPFFYLTKWSFKLAIISSRAILLLVKKSLARK
ncbi:MAG: DUF1700 domain-containing protein [Clostridia bacterium]|nr:DUF1700 domain-containing protein [Clostridia bacterium]